MVPVSIVGIDNELDQRRQICFVKDLMLHAAWHIVREGHLPYSVLFMTVLASDVSSVQTMKLVRSHLKLVQ